MIVFNEPGPGDMPLDPAMLDYANAAVLSDNWEDVARFYDIYLHGC